MGFRALLGSLVERVKGSEGAFLMAFDGILIDGVAKEGVDLEVIGAEYASLLRDALTLGRELGLGETRGISILSEGQSLAFVFPKGDFTLGVLVGASGCHARARHVLRHVLPAVEKEL